MVAAAANCWKVSSLNTVSSDIFSLQLTTVFSRRAVLSNLRQIAAIATIIGTIFTVATYFSFSDEPAETGVPPASTDVSKRQAAPTVPSDEPAEIVVPPVPASTNLSQRQTGPTVGEDNGRQTDAAAASNPDISEAEIRIRFDAARKISGPSTKSRTLQQLAKKASDLGFLGTAFTIALEIPGPNTRSNTLGYVARMAKKLGELELAIRIAETIPGPNTRNKVLSEISEINDN